MYFQSTGALQAYFFTEHVLYNIATAAGIPPSKVREANLKLLRMLPNPADPGGGEVEGVPALVMDFDNPGSCVEYVVPKDQYTLPEIWKQLREGARFEDRCLEVR